MNWESRAETTSYFHEAVIFRLAVAGFCFGKLFISKLLLLVFLHQDEPSPPRPEAYPIPTQTYPRDYFTIPASKSQDRVIGPGQGPAQHWQGMEDRERLPVVDNVHNSMQVQETELSHWALSFCRVSPLSTSMFCCLLPSGSTTPRKTCTQQEEDWGQRISCSSTISRTTSTENWSTNTAIWTTREVCQVGRVCHLETDMRWVAALKWLADLNNKLRQIL